MIRTLKDLNFSESLMLIALTIPIIFFGFYPQPLMDTINISVNNLISNYQIDLIYNLKN